MVGAAASSRSTLAIAFGFTGLGHFRRIVLPPLLLSAAPVVGNQIIQIVKDSAFLTVIALPELTHAASSIQSRHYIPFAAFITAVLLYWTLCLVDRGGRRVHRPPCRGAPMMPIPLPLTTASRRADRGGALEGLRLPSRCSANISFQVACGETVCLLGPSGSGKSTLLAASTGWRGPMRPDLSQWRAGSA